MSGKQIQNDQDYDKSLLWMRTTAAELADPLKDIPDRDKKMKVYDHVSDLCERYNRGRLARQFPGLRKVYAELGWNYDELPQQPAPEAVQPAEQTAEPPKQEPQAKTVLADWLDD